MTTTDPRPRTDRRRAAPARRRRAAAFRLAAARARARQAQPDQDLAHARGADRRHAAADHLPGAVHLHLRRRDRRRLAARLPAVPAARASSARRSRWPASRSASTSTPTSRRASSTGSGRCRSPARRRWSAPCSADVVRYLILLRRHARLRLRDGLPGRRPTPLAALAALPARDRRSRCASCWISVFVGMNARTPGRRAGHHVPARAAADASAATPSSRPTRCPAGCRPSSTSTRSPTWSARVRGLMLGGPVRRAPAVDARLDGRPAGRVRAARAARLPPPRLTRRRSSRARRRVARQAAAARVGARRAPRRRGRRAAARSARRPRGRPRSSAPAQRARAAPSSSAALARRRPRARRPRPPTTPDGGRRSACRSSPTAAGVGAARAARSAALEVAVLERDERRAAQRPSRAAVARLGRAGSRGRCASAPASSLARSLARRRARRREPRPRRASDAR